MDNMIKYFIGGSIALMTFFLLAPTLINGMVDAQTEYESQGFLNNTVEFDIGVVEYVNTTTISSGAETFIALEAGNTTGYFDFSTDGYTTVGEFTKLDITTEITVPENSSLTLTSVNTTYELEDGVNTIEFDEPRTTFRVDYWVDPSVDQFDRPVVHGYEPYETVENEFASILGLLFVLFTIVGVWRFYSST